MGDADRASLKLDLLVLHFDDADLRLGTSGVYEDTLPREPQGWRIAQRKITVDGQARDFRRRRGAGDESGEETPR